MNLRAIGAVLICSLLTPFAAPVKVFILAGQSNMEGKAKISLLEHQLKQSETRARFAHLVDANGQFKVRADVWIKFLDRKGNLTVGFGSPKRIGPELEFGNVIGNVLDEQVLLIKTAWGGKSLYWDFRSPSSGAPEAEVVTSLLKKVQRKKPDTTAKDVADTAGHFYRLMLSEVRETLANLDALFAAYAGQGYEVAGLVWFQGWNDMVNAEYTAAYAANMANFIRDVRKDLDLPGLPVVIGQLGVGGTNDPKPNPKRDQFKLAQAEAARLPEFTGTVKLVKTDQYWDETAAAVFAKGWKNNFEKWQTVGSDYPFHYLGSTTTYCDIGKAFGEAMLELLEN
jgi:alpha-galactosidase